MSINFRQKSEMHNHLLKNTRLVFEVMIDSNATPANKSHIVDDLQGVVYLRSEGKTSEADAVEDLTGQVTAPSDANGIFAVLVDDQCKKFYKAEVTPDSGTVAVTKSISTGGRLVLDIDSSVSLATTDLVCLIELEYRNP